MEVTTYNLDGTEAGKTALPSELFVAEVSKTLVWEAIKAQRACARQGTASTKRRGDVRGGGAKPFKQKGGGRARQGSTRAPHMVGGGVVMGPLPRDYSYRLPRSARRAALKHALSARVQSEGLAVLKGAEMDSPKTKTIAQFIKATGARRVLFVDADNQGLALSARNIKGSKYLPAHALNVKDIIDHDLVVFAEGAVSSVTAKIQGVKVQSEQGAAA